MYLKGKEAILLIYLSQVVSKLVAQKKEKYNLIRKEELSLFGCRGFSLKGHVDFFFVCTDQFIFGFAFRFLRTLWCGESGE